MLKGPKRQSALGPTDPDSLAGTLLDAFSLTFTHAPPQEPRLQPAAVRAVQAEPRAAVHRQLCAQVLGGRPAAGKVRGGDPGGVSLDMHSMCNIVRAMLRRLRWLP